ncbi:MAG TPA: UbiD family decarboxylase [Dehalococcoidia bacterium]|nr:UbiD family decarboxylase [Dehalococcoidia bacterium]
MAEQRAPRNMRKYLELLRETGELIEVKEEVDWHLEAAAITALGMRSAVDLHHPLEGKTYWFPKIKGYPKGYGLMTSAFAGTYERPWRHLAMAQGLDPDIDLMTWMFEQANRLQNPIKPILVDTGPCKEEKHFGKDVNIFEFPLPYIHQGDGGRYGGTLTNFVLKHPEMDWMDVANYRWMAHTRNRLGMDLEPYQTGGMIYYVYETRGQSCPFAISIGGPPMLAYAACLPLPVGWNEYDYCGGLMQEPLELVHCETNDLLVPAEAEVVIEGEIRPYERWDEGPFGEMIGYMQTPRRPRPVLHIHAITHRKDMVIWPVAIEGFRFATETFPIWYSAVISSFPGIFAQAGLPGAMTAIPKGIMANFHFLAESYKDAGVIDAVIEQGGRMGVATTSYMFLDSDLGIDVSTEELWEEIITRTRPDRVTNTMPKSHSSFYKAWLTPEEQLGGSPMLRWDATTHDGDRPRARLKPETLWSQAVLERVEELRARIV